MSEANERAALRAIALRGPAAIMETLSDLLALAFSNANSVKLCYEIRSAAGGMSIQSVIENAHLKRVTELERECFDGDHMWSMAPKEREDLPPIKQCERCGERWGRPM